MTTKALIYTRFSPRRAEQMDNCVSPEVQEQACRAYAESKGYEVVGVFGDEGVSRNKLDRPGLARCVDRVKRGYVVLFYHPDRLGSIMVATYVTMEVERRGGRLEFSQDELNGDGPEMAMMRGMLHLMAEFTRAQGGLRTAAAMQRRQNNGELMTAPSKLAYGLMMDPDDDSRVIENPEEAAIVDRIIELYNGDGHTPGLGYRLICSALNDEGLTNRSGGPWWPSTVRSIIKRWEREHA